MARWSRSRRELKINLETMPRCGGGCAGCMLSPEERVFGELWPDTTFTQTTRFISALFEAHARGANLAEASINLGPADHLLAPPERADAIVRWIKEASGGLAVGFLTVSAVGKTERIAAAVEKWREAVDRHHQPLCIDMVFDPVKTRLDHFSGTYAENISTIRTAFGAVDLALNVGPDTIRAASPAELHAFVRENGFRNLTLNLVPTPATAPTFATHWDAILAWLVGAAQAWRPTDTHGFNPCAALGPFIEAEAHFGEGDDAIERLVELIAAKAKMEFLIDGAGDIYFSQAGFGDTPFSARFGFPPEGNAFASADGAAERVATAARHFAARTTATFAAKRSCASCPHLPVCARSGAGVAMQVMKNLLVPDGRGCPLRLRTTLDALRESLKTERDMRGHDQATAGVFVPAGTAGPNQPNAIPVEPITEPVRFTAFALDMLPSPTAR